MERSLIIVGAGVAGLATGCYAQMNGYRSQIYEMHDKPGGVCTSWRRDGYTFDGCIDWLLGSSPAHPLYQFWQELGALPGPTVVDHEELLRIEGSPATGGKMLILYADVDRLERHLRELAPQDGTAIGELAEAIRQMSRLDLQDTAQWGSMTVQEFTGRLSDPFLRETFPVAFGWPGCPMMVPILALAGQNAHCAGYPIGGSLAFARSIERRYLALGGEVYYGARVARILVEPGENGGNDRAVGIRLDNGTEYRAERVISAADGHATIYELLAGHYLDDEIRGYYETWPTIPPIMQVSLGVARDFSADPAHVSFPLAQPISIGGVTQSRLTLRHYCYDPTLAAPGKSVLALWIGSDFPYWEQIGADPARYEAAKREVAQVVIAQLEARYPGLARQIEVVDVTTPLTYARYAGVWRGAYEGWLPTLASLTHSIRRTLPGLDRFAMVGQWVFPGGGLPTAVMTAREAIQTLCEQDGRTFTAQTPDGQQRIEPAQAQVAATSSSQPPMSAANSFLSLTHPSPEASTHPGA
jgi:phytoene dehydrogenase-like protein